jgi:hypothetical protein
LHEYRLHRQSQGVLSITSLAFSFPFLCSVSVVSGSFAHVVLS